MWKRIFTVAAFAMVALTACSSSGDAPSASDGASGAQAGDELTDPIVAEGNGLGSCAFEFSVDVLAEREFAFDGTVTAIREPAATDAPYEVDFAVARWFQGGSGTTATVTTYDVSGTSFAGDLALQEGERILASGDDDVLWGCGFSMPYSQDDASVFAEAFPS
ncbi:MAG TPA: hypothetical protein VIC58_04710 [Actinomycetota bacterium]|jgi:hypothetical protein